MMKRDGARRASGSGGLRRADCPSFRGGPGRACPREAAFRAGSCRSLNMGEED